MSAQSGGLWQSAVDAIYKPLHVAYAIVSLGGFVVAAVTFVASFWVGASGAWFFVPIIIASILALISISYLVYYAINLYKGRIARESYGHPHVDLVYAYTTLKILTQDQYEYTRRLKLKARRTGVNDYRLEFGYRGKIEDCTITSISSSDNKKVKANFGTLDGVLNNWIFIEFDHLTKGEAIEITYAVTISDTTKSMKPFFAFLIYVPIIDRFSHSVIFGPGITLPHRVRRRFYKKIYDLRSTDKEISVINRTVKHEVESPRIGSKYVITWD